MPREKGEKPTSHGATVMVRARIPRELHGEIQTYIDAAKRRGKRITIDQMICDLLGDFLAIANAPKGK